DVALRAHLLTVESITELAEQRVWVSLAQQDTPLPRIVLRLMPGGERQYHATGATDMVMADVEVTILATDYQTCSDLYDALREELDKKSGEWTGVAVDVARLSPPHSSLQLPIQSEDNGVESLV